MNRLAITIFLLIAAVQIALGHTRTMDDMDTAGTMCNADTINTINTINAMSTMARTLTQPEATVHTQPEATLQTQPEATTYTQPEATGQTHPGATLHTQPEATNHTRPEKTRTKNGEDMALHPAEPEQTIDADSVYIHFQVGKHILRPTHYKNAQALRKITDSLHNTIETKWVVYALSGIKITGSASPEGSLELNRRLSANRAKVIQEWVLGHSKLPAHLMKSEFLGKNWGMLLEMAQEDNNIPFREETLELLQTASDTNDILKSLQKLRKGVPYRYLLKNIFPHLRFTKIYVEYDRYPKYKPIPSITNNLTAAVTTDCRPQIKPVPLSVPPVVEEPLPEPEPERKFHFAAKTNMLYDLLITPNIGIEFNLDKQRKYSIAANWMYAWWKSDPSSWYHRTYGGDLQLRRYFGKKTQERPFTGWHAGIYGQMLTYDFEWGGRGYLGDKWSWAAGVQGGWSKQIGKRLNLDFNLGVGYLWGEYKEYLPIDDCYVWQVTKYRRWIGPTKAEISLVWIIGKW